MFSQKHRLAKTSDVQRVFGRGRAFFNPLITVKFLARSSPPSRFTVVVSTKVSKSAVKRNRLKRVLREFTRVNMGKFKLGDYALVVKPAAAVKSTAELLTRFAELCRVSKLADV